MLARRPCVRIAAKQALDDVWVNGRANKVIHMEGAVERLKEFNARRKFRVIDYHSKIICNIFTTECR